MLGLKFRRLALRLSQTDLSYRVHLPQTYISAFETGRLNPTADELDTLARALGVSDPSLLMREVEDPFAGATTTGDATPEPARAGR